VNLSCFNVTKGFNMSYPGLALLTAVVLLAGCQESPATNDAAPTAPQPATETVATSSPPATVDPPAIPKFVPRTADDVFSRMFGAYRNCRSYRDSGVMKRLFKSQLGSRETTERFTTAFSRPDRFRFTKSWTNDDGEREEIVWRNGPEFQYFWNGRPEMKPGESWDQVAQHGQPEGDIIAGLLMTGVKDSWLLNSVGHKLEGTEPIDGHECWRIEAMILNKHPGSFWVDQETYLLRQVQHRRNYSGSATDETTITWQPEFDVDIPESELGLPAPREE